MFEKIVSVTYFVNQNPNIITCSFDFDKQNTCKCRFLIFWGFSLSLSTYLGVLLMYQVHFWLNCCLHLGDYWQLKELFHGGPGVGWHLSLYTSVSATINNRFVLPLGCTYLELVLWPCLRSWQFTTLNIYWTQDCASLGWNRWSWRCFFLYSRKF